MAMEQDVVCRAKLRGSAGSTGTVAGGNMNQIRISAASQVGYVRVQSAVFDAQDKLTRLRVPTNAILDSFRPATNTSASSSTPSAAFQDSDMSSVTNSTQSSSSTLCNLPSLSLLARNLPNDVNLVESDRDERVQEQVIILKQSIRLLEVQVKTAAEALRSQVDSKERYTRVSQVQDAEAVLSTWPSAEAVWTMDARISALQSNLRALTSRLQSQRELLAQLLNERNAKNIPIIHPHVPGRGNPKLC
jgi:hypothetical protein